MEYSKEKNVNLKTYDLSQNKNRKIVLKVSLFTRILESWIDINVPVSDVWDTLINFEYE